MKKLKVGVLMGGKSQEREVSLNSGRTICDHLDIFAYQVIPLFQTKDGALYILPWRFLHRGKTTDFVHKLPTEAESLAWDDLKNLVDFVYIALHGRYGEDGILQGVLEVLQIPYLGSKVFASAVGMDKLLQKQFLQQVGIETPQSICVKPHEISNIQQIIEHMAVAQIMLPCIVKPRFEGSSFGVSVVHNQKELKNALLKAASVNQNSMQDVLIEPKIEGMEFSEILITNQTGQLQPLPPTEVVYEKDAHFWDYDQKYMPGRSLKFTPARCSKEQMLKIQQTCLAVANALGITNIARIDGFLTPDNRVVIIDPNTFSGAAPSSFLFKQAAEIDMSHTQLINHLIETELSYYGIKNPAVAAAKSKRMKKEKKVRVVVLLGGRSHEKEISLESGRNIFYKLSPHKYEPIAVFVSSDLKLYKINQKQLVCNATKEIEHSLDEAEHIKWHDLPKLCDFVFIGLHGGEGENGSVQGMLEMLGLPYNGSGVLTSALCMDKFKTTQFLHSKGFATPKAHLLSEKLASAFSCAFPAIVKPHDDGCSVGVHKVENQQEFAKAAEQLFALGKKEILVEEYLLGVELTVGVMGNDDVHVLPPSQAVAAKGVLSIEEKFLPGQGENQTPAPLSQQALEFVQKTIGQVYAALDCKGYARIDCFYQDATISPSGKERLVILEVNSLPGLTPATCIFHQAAEIGLTPMAFIDKIVELGMQLHTKTQVVVDSENQKELP